MGKKILLLKAQENYKTGEWAENNEYFDAAISRYYYCAYEKIIYISKELGFYEETKQAKNSHYDRINKFNKELRDELEPSEIIDLSKMKSLRVIRNDAEYSEKKIVCKNEFNLKFKFYFNNINTILDKLL